MVQAMIYTNIGCDSIPRKPVLQWKFTEKVKSKSLGLGSQGDWEDLILEVDANTKKNVAPHVDVLLKDGVSLDLISTN
jgi:hypothetical protein